MMVAYGVPTGKQARLIVIAINRNLSIDEGEIKLTHSRSAGPGGQNVNKVATKVSLEFDVVHSRALNHRQRAILLEALATRISKAGVLRISSGRHRTQAANRREVFRRFVELLVEALRPKTVRHETRPTRSAVERRLSEKSRHGRIKRDRQKSGCNDDF